nr:RNA-directed DNA polymerase, eukaryota [Tanacetum cinerariifolium]
FNKEELQRTEVLKVNNTTKFKKRSSKGIGYKSSGCKFKDKMFLTSIRRKKENVVPGYSSSAWYFAGVTSEKEKEITVASKLGLPSVDSSFRRQIRDGIERQQCMDLISVLDCVILSPAKDRWICDINGDGLFRVKDIRSSIDSILLPSDDISTRWVKYVPIKINVFVWRARLNRLPTHVNLDRRGVIIDFVLCPLCGAVSEDISHVLFRCDLASRIFRRICRWWELDSQDLSSFADWDVWFTSIRRPSKSKVLLKGVFFMAWCRNEDVNQNLLNKEYIDVITIDVEVERMKKDVSKKKKDSSETKQDWLSIRTRGSPKVLYNLMKNLSPAQIKDIIDIGFGSMIGMASEEIPGKIAHFVVDNFDDDSMKLGIGDVTTLEWHGQFSNKNPTPKKVFEKIQKSQMGGILFKLNFLVLFSNAMGLSENGGQCRPGKSIIGFINEETKIESLDWCKYVCMCLKMSKINWIRDGENSYFSGPLTALTLDSKIDKLDQKVTLLKLIIEDLEFEFSNCLMDHLNSSRLKDIKAKYNGIIQNTNLSDFGYAIEDNSIHHESEYGNVFSEMDNSLNFNDMSGNYNVGEFSHGVEELDNDFINETNEENGEDSSEEEMIEEVNQKIIEADIVLQKSINDDVQSKDLNCIDEDFQEKNDKKETSFDFKMFDIPKLDDKGKSVVGCFEDCLMKGLFRQDAQPDNSVRSFGNPFQVSTSDMPKHRLDEPQSFSLGPEFDDFSIEEINQTNVKDESEVAFSETESHCSHKEKQSFDRIQTVFFQAESEI